MLCFVNKLKFDFLKSETEMKFNQNLFPSMLYRWVNCSCVHVGDPLSKENHKCEASELSL